MKALIRRTILLSSLGLLNGACGVEVQMGAGAVDASVTVPPSAIELASTQGCTLDVDCAEGLFCFQNHCTWECETDEDCRVGATCSPNGRCVLPASLRPTQPTASGELDEEGFADVAGQQPVAIAEYPPSVVEIDPGEPFVTVSLRTAGPVEGNAIMYRVELEGEEGTTPRSLRSEGEREFRFQIPTGRASGSQGEADLQRVYLTTSIGGFPIDVVPRIALGGLYAADVAVREFGGSGLPIRFGLRVEPENASLEEAQERSILLPASAQDLLSPLRDASTAGAQAKWVRRPLEWDPVGQVWFARFAHRFEIGGNSQFGGGQTTRLIRIEIHAVEGKRIRGALADRWEGLFDSRTADGVVVPAQVVLSGPFLAHRQERLPAEAVDPIEGEASVPSPPLGNPLPITECPDNVLEPLLAQVALLSPNPCEGITGVETFRRAGSEARAHCALAITERALEGPSTAAQVRAFLDDDQPNPGGISFGEFLERCAAGDGYCVPSPDLLCSEQLLAFAYQAQTTELGVAGELLENYQLAARESYLGRQLAAFQVDTNTRLDWLRTSEAPLFLASELRAYNEEILAKWERQVLQAHFDVLARQFTPSSLEVLGRAPTDPDAIAIRKTILLEQAQTWQGAMEALQIAAQRWNSLHQDDRKREEAAAYVRGRTLDLYLAAAVLSHLNRSSGSSATSSIFGSGFAALMRTQEQLSLPFNDLIFMRDAEVVVSRSVDPLSSANTVLRELEELARKAVEDAQASVDRVLDDAQEREVNAQVLTERMQTQDEELRAELVALCGLPQGCTVNDMSERPECAVMVEAGRCGFLLDPASGEYQSFEELEGMENVSEAGQALLAYRQALLEYRMAQDEFRANEERARIELQNAQAFADNLERWQQRRAEVEVEADRIGAEIDAIENATFAAHFAEIEQARKIRKAAYETQAQEIKNWAKIRNAGITADMQKMTAINALNRTADGLTLAGDEIDRVAALVKDGMPMSAGLSADFTFAARLAMGMSAFFVTTGMRSVAFGLDTIAMHLEAQLTEEQARREAQLSELSDLADLGAMRTENELEEIAAQLRQIELVNDREIAIRESLIEVMKRGLELDIAHDRDLMELEDRRLQAKIRLQDSAAAKVRILRAEIVAAQRQMAYMEVVQRAQLIQGRSLALQERLNQLENLIASPSVIFAYSNRLARAESRVERAKGLLYDWLVALEYYAVRPFINQRLAILLARNPSQLEAISNELLRLQRVCGGMITYETVDLSLRDDLLRGGFAMRQAEDQGIIEPAQRFRAVLAKGNVPVDTQVRYSTDESIGDVIANRSVLAATFDLRLDDFANLALTCNAKIASIDVHLVGEGLGEHVRPTVSILYDGTSTMRSCQPNIAAIVGALDPGTTSFGPRTTFRTAGRSVSPVARIGEFGEPGTANRGLEGLPLASTYTVMIDPQKGENGKVDWSALDDVMLRLTYVYQDMFPAGQCE